jgi:cellulose synthase/poly-beta-1,6-N-acetylglucosamine synthase-like glycosyltransferase
MLSLVLSILGVGGSAIWLVFAGTAGWHRGWVRYLRELPDREPEGGWPDLAVVFAARDEQAQVEPAVRSMLALDYPRLEVIAVDDRSTDSTGSILDRLAASDPRLSVVHVTELPAGWLGKSHALHSALQRTEARWVLFTDADVVFAAEAVRRAVALAESEHLAHLTVAPEIPTETLGERLFLAMFQVGLAMHSPGWRVRDPNHPAFLGIGAFNLARAGDLRAIGGFERIRLSVDDDMQLGRALKWSGRRSQPVLGAGVVCVRWQVGISGMVRGLEKNFFAGARFRLGRVILFLAAMALVGIAPFVGLFVGPLPCRAICVLGVATIAVMLQLMGAPSGIRWYHALLMPVSALVCMAALVRSTWLTLRRGGVSWRGHLYPLGELRQHVRMREAWMRELWLSTR